MNAMSTMIFQTLAIIQQRNPKQYDCHPDNDLPESFLPNLVIIIPIKIVIHFAPYEYSDQVLDRFIMKSTPMWSGLILVPLYQN